MIIKSKPGRVLWERSGFDTFNNVESVFEHEGVVVFVYVDDDGFVFVDGLGEDVFRQTVEHHAVDDSLDGTGAEFGVVAFVGEV